MRKIFTIAIIALSINAFAQIPTNGLVGYYPFNGDANDQSINGNNGTVNGATLTIDRFGNANSAYSFDGINNNISLSQPFLNGAFTFSVWVKFTGVQTGFWGAIFTNGVVHGNWGDGFFAYVSNTNDIIHFDKAPDPTGFHSSDTVDLNDNNFHHFVFIWDGLTNSNSVKMFHNNILVYSGACISNLINASQNLTFGYGSDGGANFPFKGILDDIGIWDRELTLSEITQIYNTGICYQTITVTDTLIINANLTGFNPVTYQNTIKVYPNPTNDHITIDYGNYSTLTGYTLKITNSLGQTVFTSAINQQQSYVDLSTWSGNGIYFVHLIDAQSNTIDIRKIVLQ